MTDSVETIRCSNCKKDILSTNFVVHDIHCQRNIYLCSKCNEPVNHNNRAEHDKANHVLVFCTSCHTQVEKYLLKKHMKNTCSQRKVQCQICDIEIGACDIVEHENYCGARTEKCSECGEFVMLKYKQLHIDSNHTFIKLSDEPGPSPSWQNGRRTLGNFLPDLHSGLYTTNPSHQKKRLGRSEHGRRRAKGSPEMSENDEKRKELTSPDGKQKGSGHERNFDTAGSSPPRDYRRRVSGGGADYGSGKDRVPKKSASEKAGCESNDVNSVEGVNRDWYSSRSKGKDHPRKLGGPSTKQKWDGSFKKPEEENGVAGEKNNTDEDLSLALALQLNDELNGRFHSNKEEIIGKSVEKETSESSEFSLFNKNKVSTDKNLSKNFYTEKKQSKTSFNYENDSYDDNFLLYAQNPEKDADDTSLPCQFCNFLYPSHALMSHQRKCKSNGEFDVFGMTK